MASSMSFRDRVARRGGGGPGITAEDVEHAEFREIARVDDQDGPNVASAIFAQATAFPRLTRVELIKPDGLTKRLFLDQKLVEPLDYRWLACQLMRDAAA